MDGTTKFFLRAIASAGIAVVPLAAFGQSAPGFSGEITTGVGYQSANAPAYGRYSGNAVKGVSGFGSFKFDYADPPESGKTGYFKAEGDKFDVDGHQIAPDAAASAKFGEQGKWGVKVDYDGISSMSPGRR